MSGRPIGAKLGLVTQLASKRTSAASVTEVQIP
jgi:hypothetical protein